MYMYKDKAWLRHYERNRTNKIINTISTNTKDLVRVRNVMFVSAVCKKLPAWRTEICMNVCTTYTRSAITGRLVGKRAAD